MPSLVSLSPWWGAQAARGRARAAGGTARKRAVKCFAALSVCLAASLPATAQELRRTTVTVSDHLSDGQQEETIAVYFAGVLAGTLHVAPGKPDDSFTATIPERDHLGYTLCGKLERREADGGTSSHPIDNGGVLSGYSGQTLMAITHGDVLFSLESESTDVISTVQPGPACTAATS